MFPSRFWRDLSMPTLNQLLTHCFIKSNLSISAENRPHNKSLFKRKKLRIAFRPKRRPALYLRSHSSLRYRMAPWPHLQTTPSSSGRAHDFIDYGTCLKSNFYSHQLCHRAKQVKRLKNGISQAVMALIECKQSGRTRTP